MNFWRLFGRRDNNRARDDAERARIRRPREQATSRAFLAMRSEAEAAAEFRKIQAQTAREDVRRARYRRAYHDDYDC